MSKSLLPFFLVIFCLSTVFSQNTPDAVKRKIAPDVQSALKQENKVNILVIFREQADLHNANQIHGKAAKARFVFDRLQQTAATSQANALRIARASNAYVNSFYLVNALAIRHANAGLVENLAQLPEVARIAADPEIPFEQPDVSLAPVAQRGAVEWGIEKINAPAVWALGYTGQGITVAGADTGYDWVHPAIQPHYRGYNKSDGSTNHNYNWHDAIHEISPLSNDSIPDPSNNPCGVNSVVPCDDNNHGTHTMGTMVGDDGNGNQIGVAPGADWIACRNMERGNGAPSSYIECFEWFLAPTDLNGENPDVLKAPHVINNSWYCSVSEGCTDLSVNELMHTAVNNLRASGVVVVVSNGNKGGLGCNATNDPPAYFEESFSVGATESNDTITGFSTRGSVQIDGSGRMKPNVVAPGAGIRSSIRNGGYAHFWGTSMAGPHVAGVVALVISARPDLAGEVDLIEDIIEQTAVPGYDTVNCGNVSGMAHPNNTYGYGRVDALGAVMKALMLTPVTSPGASPVDVTVWPNPVLDEAIFSIKNYTGKFTVQLFNAAGQLVYSVNRETANPDAVFQIPMQNQAPGVYFWKITTAGPLRSGKFVKR
ncbi:MAG: S8 family peptidase [Lewinellaceae bacterium]|nr:S8 family peptidase [Saprospiraceae bacterium]MCB9314961.1 S8 family peptidase [Lewinellaceae bacterium]MCB9329759.1 S8 family peptidase [Lewinellaceae bacterium]